MALTNLRLKSSPLTGFVFKQPRTDADIRKAIEENELRKRNKARGFTDDSGKLVADNDEIHGDDKVIEKARIKAYTKQSKSGKQVSVREHQDKRRAAMQKQNGNGKGKLYPPYGKDEGGDEFDGEQPHEKEMRHIEFMKKNYGHLLDHKKVAARHEELIKHSRKLEDAQRKLEDSKISSPGDEAQKEIDERLGDLAKDYDDEEDLFDDAEHLIEELGGDRVDGGAIDDAKQMSEDLNYYFKRNRGSMKSRDRGKLADLIDDLEEAIQEANTDGSESQPDDKPKAKSSDEAKEKEGSGKSKEGTNAKTGDTSHRMAIYTGEMSSLLEGEEPESKDSKRIEDMWTKSKKAAAGGKKETEMKMMQHAQNMAQAITSMRKAHRRGLAAEEANYHDIAKVFFQRARQLFKDGIRKASDSGLDFIGNPL